MTAPPRKTVLVIRLRDMMNPDPDFTDRGPYQYLLDKEDGELKSLDFDATEGWIDAGISIAWTFDQMKRVWNKEPHFDAITIYLSPTRDPEFAGFLTDIVDAIMTMSQPTPMLIFGMKPAEVKAGLLRMFPEHAVMYTADTYEEYLAKYREKKFGKERSEEIFGKRQDKQ